jgi:SnoaL-like protein
VTGHCEHDPKRCPRKQAQRQNSEKVTVDRAETTKTLFRAFAAGDRETVERILADDLRFSSPVDPDLDRAGYFARCWPGAGGRQEFDFVRVVESGDEILVTYEMAGPDGARGRNTEVLTFDGDRIARVEVYFGWNVP